jgi:hypothetical protein
MAHMENRYRNQADGQAILNMYASILVPYLCTRRHVTHVPVPHPKKLE